MVNYASNIEYHKLSDTTPPVYRVTVLYGEFGKRKTTTACALVKEKGLLVSSDGSWEVLLKPTHKELLDKITIVEYDGISQLRYIDYKGYDTIVLDTMSKMIDEYLDMLFDRATWGKDSLGKQRFRDNLVPNDKNDEELKNVAVPAAVDYRVTRDKFRPALSHIFKQPAHVILTAQANEPIKGLSKDETRKPRIPGATWNTIGEAASIIGFIEPHSKQGFTINVDESSTYCYGKSRVEGISGKMPLNDFIKKYREIVWT